MSCWRVLDLFEQPVNDQIPQLLIKPSFNSDSYTVHLTDLSNIWCEDLGLNDIVDRASQEQSPIEVSKQDTAQLAILLDNVAKPLQNADGATCRITRDEDVGIVLHTSMTLPAPLDCLTWKFHLQKRTSTTLKDELIFPLLLSSHVQNERITNLIDAITSKDKAITRLLDQFDSANMDLAAAFPSVGGMKAGRRIVKREQAAKYISALQPFREETWRQETSQLGDSDLTTLDLFKEVLAQSTPKVPEQLKSGTLESTWWTAVPNKLAPVKTSAKSKAKRLASPPKSKETQELSEGETEDEFDTHDNFKSRNLPLKSNVSKASRPEPSLQANDDEGNDSTEDEEDLDAPPKSHGQSQVRAVPQPEHRKSSSSGQRSSPPVTAPAATKDKTGSLRIGGKIRKPTRSPSPLPEITEPGEGPDADLPTRESVPPSSQQADMTMTPKKSRAPFRIGGKGKAGHGGASQRAATASPRKNRMRATQSPAALPPSSSPPCRAKREITPVQESHEEAPEEKAERKRTELKRKNEEAAKKQAQGKKKKRF